MPSSIEPQTWVAIYAAIVSTAAVALEVRRWFESGPRYKIKLIPNGMVIGGGDDTDEENLVIVTVINRGTIPLLVTNLTLHRMPNWWHRLRRRATTDYVVPNPQLKGSPRNIPGSLEPAQTWTGVVRDRPDIIPDLRDGTYYVGVSISHGDRPKVVRIPKVRKHQTKTWPVRRAV